MNDFFQVMLLPFLACLVLTGMHAYLGIHVIRRQVIFVDLALAQIAVLGAGVALILGYDSNSMMSYVLSVGFTVFGALLFSTSRFSARNIPQEALIGIVYVVAAALLLIVLSCSGEGAEHLRHSLIGDILLITPKELFTIAVVYLVIGMVHYRFRKQFFMVADDRVAAQRKGLNVRGWDFLFYVMFGLVVTSSVKLAGVLLVFSFLVIPVVCAMLFFKEVRSCLLAGWGVGAIGSFLGLFFSYWLDIPTGASVVTVMGAIFFIASALKH